MALVIRHATKDDLPNLLAEMRKFSDFFQTKTRLYPDEAHAELVVTDLIEKHLFLIAEEGDELIGFISGYQMPHIYNPSISTLVESFWWVKESHRQSKAGLALLEEFIAIGKKDFDWVICTIEDQTPVKDETFLKRGFKLKEKSFLLEVN